MANTVAVYVRVSAHDQNEESQKIEISRWLEFNEIDDAQWFIDRDSGDHLDRPEFKRLLQAVFRGEIETVVVWKLDRLSPSLRDGINLLCDWCSRGLRVVSVTQQIDFDGKLGTTLAAVLLGVAEMEQETHHERQPAAIAVVKETPVFKIPKPGTTQADARRAHLLRRRGLTFREIAASLKVSDRTVKRYLQNA